jgi:hypothetical protein
MPFSRLLTLAPRDNPFLESTTMVLGGHRFAATIVGSCVLALSTQASAQGLVLNLPGLGRTSFSITNTSIVRYRGLNYDRNVHDDHFFSLTERLDLSMQAAPWRLYLRLDGFSPWNHDTSCTGTNTSLCYLRANWRPGSYDGDGGGSYANISNALPERISLRYQRDGLTLEAGDFYQVFGRGLALAFRKVDPIGLDTTLRGGRFEYEHDRLTLRGFIGLANPQNLDPISLAVFSDPEDLLAGASFAARAGDDGDIEVSGHALHVNFERDDNASRQDTVDVAGWRFEIPSLMDGALQLYGEANMLHRESRVGVAANGTQSGPTRQSWGRGVYAAAQLRIGQVTLLGEWKDYTNYLVAPGQLGGSTPRDVARIYSTAPSLERDDQRLFTNSNTRGARLRVDYAFESSPWILSLNSVLYGWSDHFDADGNLVDPWDNVDGYLTTHSYFTVRRRSRPVVQGAGQGTDPAQAAASAGGVTRVAPGDFNLVASIGYRRDMHNGTEQSDPGRTPAFVPGDVKHESIQADFDIAFPVGTNDSLELRIDNRIERNFSYDPLRGFIGANLGDSNTGVRGGVALSWSHGLPLVLSAMLRWDNTSRGPGNASIFDDSLGIAPDPANPLLDPRFPTLYPSGEVRWNFSLSSFVRVFGGITPGGRVCSGGVCRDVPLFQGGVLELVLRI